MSEDVAKKRIRLARLARRHPAILERIADGHIGLTALLMMSAVLFHATPDEATELLDEARGKTNDEVAILLVARSPKPDTPTSVEPAEAPALFSNEVGAVRPLVPSSSPEVGGSMGPECASAATTTAPVAPVAPVAPAPTAPIVPAVSPLPTTPTTPPTTRAHVAPLAPSRFEFRTTLDEQTLAELREAAELLSHVIPNGDLGLVLARLVREGLQNVRKQRRAESYKPRARRAERSTETTAHIPEHIVRAVYARDKGCCTFRSADGHVCGSRWQVELDHSRPRAKGGDSSLDNLRLLCRAHNQHEAERVLGAGFMRGKRAWAAKHRKANARSSEEPRACALP
jgi:5-methylcytosine-specific restriction endonuclease McrA